MLRVFDSASMQDAAVAATSSIIKDSVLGALLVVAVGLLVWLVTKVLSVQDLRVADQRRMSERLQKVQERQGELMEKVGEAFSSFKSAVDRLSSAQDRSRAAMEDLCRAFEGTRATLDSVVREAVRRQDGQHERSRYRSDAVNSSAPPPPKKGG